MVDFGELHRQPIAAVAALVLSVGAASAHHSFSAEFDANQPIQLRGTVAKVEWINPHTWIHIDVKKDDGTVESWAIEGGTPCEDPGMRAAPASDAASHLRVISQVPCLHNCWSGHAALRRLLC